MAVGNIASIIAGACLAYLPTHMKWNRLVSYWFTSCQAWLALFFCLNYEADMYTLQSVGFSLSLVMISNNVGGYTKKTFTMAMTFAGVSVCLLVSWLRIR